MIPYKNLVIWPERDSDSEVNAYYCDITDDTGKEITTTENQPTIASAIRVAREWIDAHLQAGAE